MIEDYLFWRLAHFFVVTMEYRIVHYSSDQRELWLEKKEDKKFPLLRLYRYDLDWSNWMQQDIEKVASKGEFIRKQLTFKEVKVLNLYISAFPPVDDYEFRIKDDFYHPFSRKTSVRTCIVERSNWIEEINRLETIFNEKIDLSNGISVDDNDIETIKAETFAIARRRTQEERKLFEQGKPFFTYVFIAVQVAVFLLLEVFGGSTDPSTLIKFGAKFNPYILEGEWWRFITPMFLHIGFLHLAMNTLALYYLGQTVERIFGKGRFLFIYFIAGLAGSIGSFLFSPHLSAGASGAIFGCFGALLYFGLIYPKLFMRTMGFNIVAIILINLSLGFSVPGIDNAAHIGGLVGGFFASGIVHFPKKRKWKTQFICFILTVLLSTGMIRYGFANPQYVLDESTILMTAQHYIDAKQYEDAYFFLTEMGDGKSHSADYYFVLSYAEIHLDKKEDAIAHLQEAIDLNPNFHEAHYNIALLFLEKGKIKEAKKHLNIAIEIEPDKKEYKKLLAEIDKYY